MGGSSYSTGSSSFFQRSSAHHRRKDKDVGSTLSADSGAMDVGEPMGGRDRDSCSLHFKSQSIPETSQRRPVGGSSSSAIGACGALASASCSSGKKASEFGDSGLCLLTDTPSTTLMAPPPVPPKEKVLHWIMNNDKCQEGDRADPSSIKYRYAEEHHFHWFDHLEVWQLIKWIARFRSRPPSSTSPISSRRSRKQAPYNSSRSESLERSGAGGPVGGSSLVQPDCSAAAIDSRNRPPTKPKSVDVSPSSQDVCVNMEMLFYRPAPVAPVVAVQSSTLKKPANAATSAGRFSCEICAHTLNETNLSWCPITGDVGVGGSSTMSSECTVVMFTFGEEPVPYRSKISGRTVTLRQFKDILPKKGNYKYVTLCLHVLVSRITIKILHWQILFQDQLRWWCGPGSLSGSNGRIGSFTSLGRQSLGPCQVDRLISNRSKSLDQKPIYFQPEMNKQTTKMTTTFKRRNFLFLFFYKSFFFF